MKVIIWGAGKGCKRALTVCKALNWMVIGIVDSDSRKRGIKIEGHSVQGSDILKNIDEETYILIAASEPDLTELAKKYTKHIINWNTLSVLYRGAAQYPNYETRNLEDRNIKNCKLLKNRTVLLEQLTKHYDRKFIFAEVGVAFGDFSKAILSICKPSKLYLIDFWGGERYRSGLEIVENIFVDEISKEIVEIRRDYSFEALKKFEDDSLDVVYIDTDHTYETTWKELLICLKKVKEDGFICGHDYTKYNSYSRLDYGVYDAVNRFCVEYNFELCYLTMEKEGFHSFALKKIK